MLEKHGLALITLVAFLGSLAYWHYHPESGETLVWSAFVAFSVSVGIPVPKVGRKP